MALVKESCSAHAHLQCIQSRAGAACLHVALYSAGDGRQRRAWCNMIMHYNAGQRALASVGLAPCHDGKRLSGSARKTGTSRIACMDDWTAERFAHDAACEQ